MSIGRCFRKHHVQHRSLSQIEACFISPDQGFELSALSQFIQAPKIGRLPSKGAGLPNHLERNLYAELLVKHRPKNFVAIDNGMDHFPESILIQVTCNQNLRLRPERPWSLRLLGPGAFLLKRESETVNSIRTHSRCNLLETNLG